MFPAGVEVRTSKSAVSLPQLRFGERNAHFYRDPAPRQVSHVDMLEGYLRFYDRRFMDFTLPDGLSVSVRIYIMKPHD